MRLTCRGIELIDGNEWSEQVEVTEERGSYFVGRCEAGGSGVRLTCRGIELI